MMEEKKESKINVSTVLLIIAIIIIIVMTFFMYKIYTDKENAYKKIEELNSQADNLKANVDTLQGKIDEISKTIKDEDNTDKDLSDIKYEISIRDEIYATIKATKNGNTVTKEFDIGAAIGKTGTMILPTIGSVAIVESSGGEYCGVTVYQLVNDKIEELGTINCGADMVKEATYDVTTKGESTAVITAKRNDENIKKEFEMNAAIAKTEVIDVLNFGKVVLVAETGGESYLYKVFRLSQDYTNGKTEGIIEAGTIKYIF